MKTIKNAFGRFYLNHPKTVSHSVWIAYILIVFCGVSWAISLVSSGSFSVIFSGGFFFFLVLFWFLCHSHNWTKELPEYFISEAEKILESKKIVSPKLESLMEQAKTSKGEDGLNELKNWLKLFEDYKSLKENLPQLQEQQDEITTKISESMEKRNQLRMDLLIS